MPSRTLNLGLIQMRCDGTPSANMERAIAYVEQAVRDGAQVVVLPELFQHGWFCQTEGDGTTARASEPIPGPTTERLSELSRRLNVVLIGGTLIESASDGLVYNTATVFDADGRLLGSYRKFHIPMEEGFYEQSYFARGDGKARVFHTKFGVIAVMICYDQWFPEMAREASLQGAELLVYTSAIGDISHMRFRDECSWARMWLNAHLGHAAVNNVYVAAVNRVGTDGKITFWGSSFIIDPSSRLLVQGGCAEEVVHACLDLARVSELQEAWGFLRDLRSGGGVDHG